jgi:hypothetical protein
MGMMGWIDKMVDVFLYEKEKEDKKSSSFLRLGNCCKCECLFAGSDFYSVFLSLTASFSPGFLILTIFLIPATALVPYL